MVKRIFNSKVFWLMLLLLVFTALSYSSGTKAKVDETLDAFNKFQNFITTISDVIKYAAYYGAIIFGTIWALTNLIQKNWENFINQFFTVAFIVIILFAISSIMGYLGGSVIDENKINKVEIVRVEKDTKLNLNIDKRR